MRKAIFAAFLGASLISGLALAEESKPVKLTAAQMDTVTAGGLGLPSGTEVFAEFENPAPFPLHPALWKALTTGKPVVFGPWQAHFNSPSNSQFDPVIVEVPASP